MHTFVYVLGTPASAVSSGTPDVRGTSQSVSTVISLLSTLCRGSPEVTHNLLRLELLDAIENSLQVGLNHQRANCGLLILITAAAITVSISHFEHNHVKEIASVDVTRLILFSFLVECERKIQKVLNPTRDFRYSPRL